MERDKDVQLIQKILTGDDIAFNVLVKKHHQNVHTLVWRNIGNFRDAEEITQDTFLKVYDKLATLKDPRRFSGWVYKIATRQCVVFQRKKRIQTQSLEDTDIKRIEKMTYSQYIADQQAKAAIEIQRDIVQRLLSRLSEREQSVVTLHYFQDMTCKEIGRFLGTSENTIKSQLHRARQRLKRARTIVKKHEKAFK